MENNGKRARHGNVPSSHRDLVFLDHAGRREITGHKRGLGLNTKQERRVSLVLRGFARNKRESTNVLDDLVSIPYIRQCESMERDNRCYNRSS